MIDVGEGAPQSEPAKKVEYLDIKGSSLGFHYTIDQGLAGELEHGILSRWEEEKRGLRIRVGASRSMPDIVYFTTRVNDVYFLNRDKPVTDTNDLMDDVVGVVIDRPRENLGKHGHFGVKDFVDPNRFKALIIIDRAIEYKPQHLQLDAFDKYRFVNPYPEDRMAKRIAKIREMCQEKGRDIPIYGVSGDMYYPEKKEYRAIVREIWEKRKAAT